MAQSTNKNEYNEDELYAPNWLNSDFLETAIRSYEQTDSVKVLNFDVSPGTAKGDHYGSVMFRIKLNYTAGGNEHKYKSLIIKTMPDQDGAKKELLREFTLFETEIFMYTKILPKMEGYLKSIGDNTQLCAKVIYSSLEPRKCIMFEDLVEQGYSVVSKRVCTLDEANGALYKLAKFQAASYKLLNEGNTEITKYKSIFSKESIDNMPFIKSGIKDFMNFISECDELKKYVPYVSKIEESLKDEITSYFDLENMQKYGGILAFNHGDFHLKNLMVKYDGNAFKDVMLLDYQVSYYGPTVLDVLNATILMFSPELRKNYREEIFSKYFKTFSETLEKFKMQCDVPTKAMFDAELKRYRRWELFLTMNFFIFGYVFVDGSLELRDYIEKPETRLNFWKRDVIINDLRIQLDYLVNQGCFE